MPKQTTSLWLPLLLSTLLSTLPTTLAFPLPSSPAALTNAPLLLPDQIPSMAAPTAPSSWSGGRKSPHIFICPLPLFAGDCFLLKENTAQTCLDLDSNAGGGGTTEAVGTGSMGLGVGSLRVGGGGGCVVFGASGCTGESKLFAPDDDNNDDDEGHVEVHNLQASGFNGKVMSLYCEPSRSFSPLDPVQEEAVTHQDTSEKRDRLSLSLSGNEKASRRSRRHAKRLSESAPDAHTDPESQPEKASLLLNPREPEPGRSRTFNTLCGDGMSYAVGGEGGGAGCIGPGHARSVNVEGGLGDDDATS